MYIYMEISYVSLWINFEGLMIFGLTLYWFWAFVDVNEISDE